MFCQLNYNSKYKINATPYPPPHNFVGAQRSASGGLQKSYMIFARGGVGVTSGPPEAKIETLRILTFPHPSKD